MKLFPGSGANVKSAMDRARQFAVRAVLNATLLAVAAACHAQTNIAEFALPVNITVGPYHLASGADGAYWIANYYGPNSTGLIGRIDTVSNIMTEIPLLTNLNTYDVPQAEPFDICKGPNGPNDPNLWFTEAEANQIGRININSNYQEFPLANANTAPGNIVVGPDGNLWFIEFNLNRIAAITPAPLTNAAGDLVLVHEYGPFGTNSTAFGGLPGTNAYMYGLASGTDGNLWFTQYTYGTVGKLNPATGAYTLFQLPFSNSCPYSIVQGADGAFWFTEYNSNNIGRITTTGQLIEYPLPTAGAFPAGILATADSNIWFTEFAGGSIGRLTPQGVFTIFPTPTLSSSPTFLATGPDSNIWFSEYVGGFVNGRNLNTKNIGRLLVTQSLALSVTATNLIGTNFNGVLATYQNSVSNNAVTVAWGDGNFSIISVSSLPVSVTNLVVVNSQTFTNTMTITQTVPIDTNNDNGTFVISVNHTYSVLANFPITITITDPRSDTAVANLSANSSNAPPVFIGEHVTNGALVLSLNGQPGRTYSVQATPSLNPPVWTTIGSVTVPPGATTVNFTNTISPSNHFFRLSYP